MRCLASTLISLAAQFRSRSLVMGITYSELGRFMLRFLTESLWSGLAVAIWLSKNSSLLTLRKSWSNWIRFKDSRLQLLTLKRTKIISLRVSVCQEKKVLHRLLSALKSAMMSWYTRLSLQLYCQGPIIRSGSPKNSWIIWEIALQGP